ncbi:PAS domain-containing protein [Halorubellus sp. PRR65]|uniref:PAS domain-containing protein n=1 Tax=Halorubellus sp. PRR65 TaxID=3098148 RepID=UPI002B25AC46|nr:PAS domain-containing protein [Halorubellus sp. PRR65]
MAESHAIVCTGERAGAVADALDAAGFDVERADGVEAAVERARSGAGVVLAVDPTTDPSVVGRVRERVPASPVVVVATAVDGSLASTAVDAGVTALCTVDDDVAETVEAAFEPLDATSTATGRGVASTTGSPSDGSDAADESGSGSVDATDGRKPGSVDATRPGPRSPTVDWRGHVVDRLFETSPDRLAVVAADGTVVRANDRAREAFAISIGETHTGDVDVYDTEGEFVPPEARPWASVFRSGEASYGHQFRVDPVDGESAWYVADVVPLGDGPAAAFVSFRDVTGDERGRERLQQRKDELVAELDETLERVTDAFFALDDEFRFTYLNETASELLGVDSEALRGESIWDAFPDAVGTTFEAQYRTAMREQESVAFEEFFPPLSTWFAVRAYPSETGLSVYFQDVTDRKDREAALNERLAQQEVVSELSREAIERADVDGFLRRAAERTAETLGASSAYLLEFGDGGPESEARVRASVGDADAVEGTVDVRPAGAHDRADPSVVTAEVGADDTPWGELVVSVDDPDAVSADDRRFVRSVGNVVASAIDRKRRERTLATKNERLAALDQLSRVVRDINRELSGHSSREEIERVVCERLANASSYEFAWIGDVDADGTVYVRTEAGVDGVLDDRELSLADATANAPAATALREDALATTQDVRTDHVDDEWRAHAEAEGYRSSVAVPLVHEDETYGVLSIYADRPHAFDGRERRVVEQLGEVVGLAIALAERDRELRERERQYRTLAENVPDATVTMFDTECAYVTVAGSLYERVLDVDEDALVGRPPGDVDALPEPVRDALCAAHEDALAGDLVEREVEVDDRTLVVRAIPVRDDGSITGGISLAQDVTERRERRAQLEHERERLEYVNRLLRHNLLNSLNVAHARTEMLDGHVDEAVEGHLETASSRLSEMIDFVETMRSLMHILVEDDHDSEPIALDSVIEGEIAKLEAAFDVTVETAGLPPVAVAADELLPEVFENLLVNAVQHNDAPEPAVFVDVAVDEDADTATVYVADNGSGVDESMRGDLFRKGEKGFDSPGTGFGLYLVRETVDAYGGEVALVDDEHSGATFAVTLPLAKTTAD